MRAVLLGLTLLLVSCTAISSPHLTIKEVQAVKSAEAFILRHGYATAGHPKDLPVEDVESMDVFATPKELIEWRRGTLEANAFGVTPCLCDADAYYVFFYRINHADGLRGVLVQDGRAVQVVHSVLVLEGWPWKRVPPNKALQPTAGRPDI